jgi:hypothetical protein
MYLCFFIQTIYSQICLIFDKTNFLIIDWQLKRQLLCVQYNLLTIPCPLVMTRYNNLHLFFLNSGIKFVLKQFDSFCLVSKITILKLSRCWLQAKQIKLIILISKIKTIEIWIWSSFFTQNQSFELDES